MGSDEVRLEDGVLKVPHGRYSLRNISYVGQRSLEIDRGRAQKWKIWAIAWLIFLVFAVASMINSSTLADFGAKWVLFLVPEPLFIWRLHKILHAPPVYALTLTTSGTECDVSWSWDDAEIEQLVNDISLALSHPDSGESNYYYTIRNTVEGDVIYQYGDGNAGKIHHSGSGDVGIG